MTPSSPLRPGLVRPAGSPPAGRTTATDTGTPVAPYVIAPGEGVGPAPGTLPEQVAHEGALYALDSGATAIYTYDLERARFIGPAPQVNTTGTEIIPLPGYPVVTGTRPPQDLALSRQGLVVAAGHDGASLGLLDQAGNIRGLVDMHLHLHSGTESVDVAVGGALPVVIGYDPYAGGVGHSWAYSVGRQGPRTAAAELPGRQTAESAAPWSATEIVILEDGTVRWLDRRTLTVTRTVRTSYAPDNLHALGRLGTHVLLAVSNPPRLVDLDPRTGRTHELLRDPGRVNGPLLAVGHLVLWAPTDSRRLYRYDARSGTSSFVRICSGASGLAVARGTVFVTCRDGRFDVVTGGRVRSYAGGGFPIAVVAPDN